MAVVQLEVEHLDLAELVKEIRDEGVLSPREVAETLFHERGRQIFLELPEEVCLDLLAKKCADYMRSSRSSITGHRVAGGKGQEPVIRVAAIGKAYWSSVWHVGGTYKETRDLNKNDLKLLIKHYYERTQEMRARSLWFAEVLKFAQRHKVETLGELEKKGIDLPSLDVEVEKN